MSHDPKGWCKMWRKTDLLFSKWQNFGESWLEHSKVSKTYTSYLSWLWRVMQNLKKNWLVVWKMIGIWQIFTRALESLNIAILMGSFNPKYKKYELKIYGGIMCHDNEEWYKLWRGINLLFPNWHEEFDKFWPKHLKVWNIFTLMCSFWANYILFKLKKYSQIIYYDTEEGYKVWKKTDLWFGKWHEEFGRFSFTRARKNHGKFEEEMRNFTNLTWALQNL